MLSLIEKRKQEHVELCLKKDVEYEHVKSGFSDVELELSSKKLAKSEIDTSTELLGKPLALPFEIEAMTGGYAGATAINKKLAKAAQENGIIFCLGSQRAMIELPRLAGTFKVRDVAPDALIFGNIGYAQLKSVNSEKIDDALKEVGADAIYVHINPIQERLQQEGDRISEEQEQQMVADIARMRKELSFPVAVKETGSGMPAEFLSRLKSAGIKIVNVSGAGGTAWGKIELMRGGKGDYEKGVIPTVDSILAGREVGGLTLIASGGIRGGVDVAKAIALGASIGGAALPFLREPNPSSLVKKWADDLKKAMSECGASNISELQNTGVILKGETAERLMK